MGQGRKPDPREQYKSVNIPGFCPPPRNCGCCCSGLHSTSRRQKAEGRKPGPISQSRLSAQPHFGDAGGLALVEQPALASALIDNVVLFTLQRAFMRLVAPGAASEEALTLPQHALVGGAAGAFSATAICPAELIKCRMQAVGYAGRRGAAGAWAEARGVATLLDNTWCGWSRGNGS